RKVAQGEVAPSQPRVANHCRRELSPTKRRRRCLAPERRIPLKIAAEEAHVRRAVSTVRAPSDNVRSRLRRVSEGAEQTGVQSEVPEDPVDIAPLRRIQHYAGVVGI